MIIDSHVHFWEFDKKRDSWITSDMKILQQNYLPEHLAMNLKRNEVDGCIAVQAAQTELETHFLVELSETHPIIKAVVGWVDLKADRIEEKLDHFYQYPAIKGWRHIVQAEPAGFLGGKEFQRGIQLFRQYGYTYDILVYASQLKEAIEFVNRFPDQVFVLDHCGKPDIGNNKIAEWKPLIKELAAHPNVYCKVSGLFTETKWKEWSAGDFYPYLDTVFEAFGTDRLLFGSDWPVMLLSGIYVQWKSLLEKYMENLPEEERQKVFGLNAIKAYNINGA
jgi:L-fuconolactonase